MQKVLCRLRWQHVGADRAGTGEAHLRVHVGAIHVHLPALRMDGLADIPDGGFEDAMRRRIGHHQRGEVVAVLLDLRAQVRDIDIAVAVAAHHHHLHARHHGGGRIGAMRRGRDEADVAMPLAPRAVPGADGEQPGILALAAGIGLQRHRGEAGDARQPGFQLADQRDIARRLVHRCEGVDVAEAGEGDGDHLRRRVQLHGAGTERDHAAVERDVLVLEGLQVAQHPVLGMVRVEHRRGHERAEATHRLGQVAGR